MIYKFMKIQKKLKKGLLRSKAGRNNQGRITVRFKGGCNKRKYRLIDFTHTEIFPIAQVLKPNEYDPFRTNNICLVKNLITNKKTYILSAVDLTKNQLIISLKSKELKKTTDNFYLNLNKILKIIYLLNLDDCMYIDNRFSSIHFNLLTYLFTKKRKYFDIPLLNKNGSVLPLFLIPKGETIFNIEQTPNSKSTLTRAAGTSSNIIYQMNNHVMIKLSSGQYKIMKNNCVAVIGRNSNIHHNKKKNTKASSMYYKNKRPHVRGVAMNPVDHPHGGGEGKTSGGRPSVTPWGILTKGYKTTKKKNLDKHQLRELLVKSENYEKTVKLNKGFTTTRQNKNVLEYSFI